MNGGRTQRGPGDDPAARTRDPAGLCAHIRRRLPGAPRLAGYVLSHTDAHDAPWHRVVRADGSLAKGARQRRLLEAEAVPFRGEKVLMSSARLDDLDAV